MPRKRLDNDELVKFFKDNGCELLEPYQHSDIPLKYICVCGGRATTAWKHFKNGVRCRKCGSKKQCDSSKMDINYVREFFKLRNCVLLEETYTRSNIPMRYMCECGSESKITWDSFKSGQRCKSCGIKKMTGSNNPRWNPDRDAVELNRVLRYRCHRLLKSSLDAVGMRKSSKTAKSLGYHQSDLAAHLASHPRWVELKDQRWSIDHIFPIKAFVDYGISDVKLINCLDNLRPILLSENCAKGDFYCNKEFEAWLATKGISKEFAKTTFSCLPKD